jgi:hypothetical protein
MPGLPSYSLYVSPSFLPTYFSDVQIIQTVKDVSALDPLVDLLESIESILRHDLHRSWVVSRGASLSQMP